MNWRIICMAVMCLLGGIEPVIGSVDVVNSGFEQGSKGWNIFIPEDSKTKNCRFEIVSTDARSGNYCARISADDFARFGVGQPLRTNSGQRLRISAWIKADAQTEIFKDNPGFLFRMFVKAGGKPVQNGLAYFIGPDGKVVFQSPSKGLKLSGIMASIPNQWRKVEAVIEAPDKFGGERLSIDGISLEFFLWMAKGSIYIDDISVEEVGRDIPLTPLVQSKEPASLKSISEKEALEALNLEAAGMEKVKAAVSQNDIAAAKRAYLEYRRSDACPARWKIMPSDMPAQAKAKDDSSGDEVARHYIRNTYYSSVAVKAADMGKDFDWTFNPVPRDDPNFSDQWTYCVISRTQFWKSLSDAYWKTLDEKYARAWVEQMTDFVLKNPVEQGTTGMGRATLWLTLDAGIRMEHSWPHSYFSFLKSPSFTPDAHWIYLQSMLDHGRYLLQGLQNSSRTGNWVTTECLGLYTIGTLFPELKEAAQFREAATDRLLVEMNRVVPPDGFEAELTPNYHYVALDGFAGVVALAKLNNLALPGLFREKLLDMYRAPAMVMDQQGETVPTNDSGIYNVINKAKQGLKLLGSSDPKLAWAVSGFTGEKGDSIPTSTSLPYAGFYAMRGGWRADDSFLFFRAGPAGVAHEHEDKLQIVFKAFGQMLLIDPGVYPYDQSDFRRYFCGTASHNTIIVDGKWQHQGQNKVPVAEPVNNPWVITPAFDYVSGTYDKGYEQNEYDPKRQYAPWKWGGSPDRSVSHTRRVLYLKPHYVLIIDTIDGAGTHTIDTHFHLNSEEAKVDSVTQGVVGKFSNDVSLVLHPLEKENLSTEVIKGQMNPLLGWKIAKAELNTIVAVPSATARFRKRQEVPAIFCTFLYPYKGAEPKFAAQPLDARESGLWARQIHAANEKMEIILSMDGSRKNMSWSSLFVGRAESRAASLILRVPNSGKEAVCAAREIEQYKDKKISFAVSAPASLVWTERGQGEWLFFNGDTRPHEVKMIIPYQKKVLIPEGTWMHVTSGQEHRVKEEPDLSLR